MTRTDKILEWLKNNKFVSIVIILTIVIAGLASTLKNVNEIADFFGFNKTDSVQNTVTDSVYATIPFSQIEGIATNLLKEKPAFYGYQNIYGDDYILVFTRSNNRFILYKRYSDLWEDIQSIDSLVGDNINTLFGPAEWEFTTIDSLPTLFVATGGFGNTAGSADFLLIPFNKDFTYSIYGIHVDGLLADSKSDAIFSNSDYEIIRNELAKKHNNFANYLERKFNQHNPVAKLEETDFDFNNPKNALKEWEIENANVVKILENEEDSSKFERDDFKIKFTYHQNDITQYLRSLEMEPDSTENGSFILYNFFKAGSFIWDKQKRQYFVAFVHENAVLNPILKEDDNLFVADEYWYGKPFTINLRTGVLKFTEIPNETQQ